ASGDRARFVVTCIVHAGRPFFQEKSRPVSIFYNRIPSKKAMTFLCNLLIFPEGRCNEKRLDAVASRKCAAVRPAARKQNRTDVSLTSLWPGQPFSVILLCSALGPDAQ